MRRGSTPSKSRPARARTGGGTTYVTAAIANQRIGELIKPQHIHQTYAPHAVRLHSQPTRTSREPSMSRWLVRTCSPHSG